MIFWIICSMKYHKCFIYLVPTACSLLLVVISGTMTDIGMLECERVNVGKINL